MENNKNKKLLWGGIILLILIIIIILLLLFWKKPMYKVTFDSNGGTEVGFVMVKKNEKVKEPEDPTKEGYIFAGWYDNEELFDFDTTITEDIILKAEWAVQGNAAIEGVSLNSKSLKLAPEATAELVATVMPENAKETKLIWTSSDESIVTVDENGNIKALKEGKATITVKTEEGGYTAKCEITVTKDTVEVTGVTISGAKEVKVGSKITLKATVAPENATNKQVTWKSSNSYVATVDKNGVVKGLKAGKVTITATTVDGKKVATYTITVKAEKNNSGSTNSGSNGNSGNTNSGESQKPSQEPSQSTVKVTGVKITGGKDIYVGDSITLTATVAPSNATNKKVTWKSSSNGIATVSDNGVVKGLKAGKVTVTVTTADGGYTDTVTINVKEKTIPVTGVKISGATKVNVGKTIQLTATITPSNASNKKVTWKSSDNGIATVSDKGVVKGVKEGTVEITVTTEDGKHTDTYKVTVQSVYKLLLKAVDTGLEGGSVMQYTATVTRDEVAFTDFTSVIIGTHTYRFKGGNNTVKASDVKGSPSVTVKLKDGTTKAATLQFI